VKTVADRCIHVAYHNKDFLNLLTWMTLNDLEPLPPKKEGFIKFFAIFGYSAHFRSELRRYGWI